MTILPYAEALYEYVENNFPNHQVALTYEAGCCGFAPACYFLHLGWEVLVVNPSDVPKMNKQHYPKNR